MTGFSPASSRPIDPSAAVDSVFGRTGAVVAVDADYSGVVATHLTGAVAATRYVGGTAIVAPSTGTFAVGDFVVAQTGVVWVCTVAGTPGTWVQIGGSGVDPLAVALGFKNWTHPGWVSSGGASLLDQFIYGSVLWLPAGTVASSLVAWIVQAGSGAPPTHFYAGLADANGVMRAQSADLAGSASLTTTGPQSFAFAAPYTTPAAGLYYAMILEVGAFGGNAVWFSAVTAASGSGKAFGANPVACVADGTHTAFPANGNVVGLSPYSDNLAFAIA